MSRRAQPVYVISVAAQLAGVHPQTLRIYERRGLVFPARTQGGDRRYSEEDIARLTRVSELAAAGVSIEGIRRIIALEEQLAELSREVTSLRELTQAALRSAQLAATDPVTDATSTRAPSQPPGGDAGTGPAE